MFGREKVAAIVAEFVGTFILASAVLAMLGRTSFPFFAAVAAGLAVAGMTLAFGAVSGGYYNPAITIAAWTVRQLETARAIVFVAAQLLGGLVAWTLNAWLLDTTLKNIANTTFDWRIFTAEAIGAGVFAMILAAGIYQGFKGITNAVNAGVGLTLGIVLASFAGNGLINPAVAIGVQSFSFIYAAGPVLGALIGMNLYMWLFTDRPKKTKVQKVVATVKAAAKSTKKVAKKTTTKKK